MRSGATAYESHVHDYRTTSAVDGNAPYPTYPRGGVGSWTFRQVEWALQVKRWIPHSSRSSSDSVIKTKLRAGDCTVKAF